MAKQRRMNREDKIDICLKRFHGQDVRRIAEETGFSFQAIYDLLQKLPGERNKMQSFAPSGIGEKKAEKIITAYFGQADMDVDKTATLTGITKENILAIFGFLRARRRTMKYKPDGMIPAVSAWVHQQGISWKDFANMTGISNIRSISLGKAYLYLSDAKVIKKVTGLSLESIYQVYLDIWNES